METIPRKYSFGESGQLVEVTPPLLFDRQDVLLVVNRFCDAYNEV